MKLFKKEWKDFCKERVKYEDTHRMQYCVAYETYEQSTFWAGQYICYGKSKIAKEGNSMYGPQYLHFMGLFGKNKSILSHHRVDVRQYSVANRLIRKIKKSEKLKFIYEIINTKGIKIRDDLYLFKVDVDQPKWKVQCALFAHRAFDNMKTDEIKWALTLNDHDLLKWMLLAYCRVNHHQRWDYWNPNNINYYVDANVLSSKPDATFELLWRMFDGDRSTYVGRNRMNVDVNYSINGELYLGTYLEKWWMTENSSRRFTADRQVHIGNKVFSMIG